MKKLEYYQNIIKEKRKETSFKDFLIDINSWTSLTFYRNSSLISKYPESDRIKICSMNQYDENIDLLIKKGFDYNFSKDFFNNFKKLFLSIDHACLYQLGKNENSDFADVILDSKNIYLSNLITLGSENVFYSTIVRINSKNIFNSLFINDNSENIYFSRGIKKSYKVFYSSYINNSSNVWFSSNLTGCSECIFCDNLQNASYYINNKKYSKEKYFLEKDKILKKKEDFLKNYKKVNNIGENYNSSDVRGSNIIESENISAGYYLFNIKNGKNLMFLGSTTGAENLFDCSSGGEGNKDIYGLCSGGHDSNIYNSVNIGSCSDIYYSQNLQNCSFCIGCVGLRNKSYCILNKQYTKKEWEDLGDKIFSQMERDQILGDFFPGELNPYYFNDTMAGLIGGFTKQEVIDKGFMWRDKELKVDIPKGFEIILTSPQPSPTGEREKSIKDFEGFDSNGNWQINPEILKKVIKDEKGNYYRIVKTEYDFLLKHGLPIPEIHWIDRMKLNFGV